jgi:hypothetical protein
MSTPTPRLLKDLAERDAKENGTKNGNGKPATNGAPKPLVVEKTPKGPRLTRAAAKVAKVAKPAVKKVPLKLTKKNGKPSKMSQAKALYAKMVKEKKDRTTILAAFMKECKLTKAGAATYYYSIKAKA